MKSLIIVFLFVLLLPSLVMAENKLYLVCNVEGNDITFVIDFENNTISNKPAIITNQQFYMKNGPDELIIDRFSGSLTLTMYGKCPNGGPGTIGTDCVYKGNCMRQETKKF